MKKLSKILVIVLLFALCLSLFSFSVSAEDTVVTLSEYYEGEYNSGVHQGYAYIFFGQVSNVFSEYGIILTTEDGVSYLYEGKTIGEEGKFGIAIYNLPEGTYTIKSYSGEKGSRNYGNDICVAHEEGILKFTISEDGTYYIVTGVNENENEEISIPTEYKGKPVKEIGSYAFAECQGVKTINIPSSVTVLKAYAFYGCGVKYINLEEANKWNSPTYSLYREYMKGYQKIKETVVNTYSFAQPENVAKALTNFVRVVTKSEMRGEMDSEGNDINTLTYTTFHWYKQDWVKNV